MVDVTELGLGGGPLGGLFQPVDDEAAAATLAAAWDSGIRYFDTAPHYGIGHSERRFGEFLREQPRDAFTLSTKVGRLLVEQDPAGRTDEAFQVPATHRRVWDFSRDGVRRSLEESLFRMGLERVDVLYLHDAGDHFDAALHDGYPALAELRAEGVVGAIGAGMENAALLTTLIQETDVEVLMLPGRYTLLDQSALDELLPAYQERRVSVIAAAVFHSGGASPAPTRHRRHVWLSDRVGGGAGPSKPHRRGVHRARCDAAPGSDGVPTDAPCGDRRCSGNALCRGGPTERQLVCDGGTHSAVE